MIFVTVGTHEQSFNRLIKKIDDLKGSNIINEDVIIQTGFSTYKPKNCTYSNLFSYNEMIMNVSKARIVITHGGPSSFIMALQYNKIPIVVPRQAKFGEHVNDHQLDFSNAVRERYGNIIVIEDIEKLRETIINYDKITYNMKRGIESNNDLFCRNLELIANNLVGKGK